MERFLLALAVLLPGALGALPTTFTVNSYDLALTFTSDYNTLVDGSVTIALTNTRATSDIVLHWGSSLTPSPPTVSNFVISYGTATVTIASVTLDTTANTVTIKTTPSTSSDTFTGSGTVSITATFKTKINRDNKGMFYRQYLGENNQNKTLFMANLRPTYARELFPCFDEPMYSGLFTVRLTYPSSWATASFTNKQTTTGTGTNVDTYQSVTLPANALTVFLAESMLQTTYSTTRSTKLTFWSRKTFSSMELLKTIQFLAEYYYMVEDCMNMGLSTNKLDIILVPGLEEPFAGYGIMYIREYNYAQDYTSPQKEGLFKNNVAPVIFQFIRQFSEFSTRPKDWSDYWLTQAITKFLHYTIMNTVMPILGYKTEMEVVARQTSLFLDSEPGAKPLQDSSFNIDSAASVQALVNDPLKRLKGAFLLNMLDQSFAAGTVFSTIRSFLSTNKDTEVTSTSFFNAIQAGVGSSTLSPTATTALQPATLGLWTQYTRNPLITIKVYKTGSPGYVNFTTTAFCQAFDPTCADLPGSYYVPVTVGSKSDNRNYGPLQVSWATNTRDVISSATIDIQPSDWIVGNIKSTGLYRTNYSADNWEAIVNAVSNGDGGLVYRTQLMDDSFALLYTRDSPLNPNITLRLSIANFRNIQYGDWVPVQRGLRKIRDSYWGLPTLYTSYKNFATGFFQNLNGFLQNSSVDSFQKARMQALIQEDLCEYDVASYRTWAIGNLTALLNGNMPDSIPSSAYDAVVCCGAWYSTNLKAQSLWGIISTYSSSYESKHFASVALGCLSNYTDIAQMYTIMTSSDIQLKPHLTTILEYLAYKQPYDFLVSCAKIADKLQAQVGAAALAKLIPLAGRRINNSTQAAVLDEFTTSAIVDEVVKSAATITKDSISSRVTWLGTNNASLLSALQAHTAPSGKSGSTVSVAISLLVLVPALLFSSVLPSFQ